MRGFGRPEADDASAGIERPPGEPLPNERVKTVKSEDLNVGGRVDRKVGANTLTGTVLGVSTEHDAMWIKWDNAGLPSSHDLTDLARQLTPHRGDPPVTHEPYHLKRVGKPSEAPYSYGSFPTKEAAIAHAGNVVRRSLNSKLDQFYIVDMSHREWLV